MGGEGAGTVLMIFFQLLFQFINVYFQVNKEDVQGLSHAKVIGMLRKITGTVELEINRYY